MDNNKFYHINKVSLFNDNDEINVRGWVYRKRGSDKVLFIIVRDVTGTLQCVVSKTDVSEKVWNDASKLYIESSLEVKGKVHKDARAPGGVELIVTELAPVCVGKPFRISKDFSTEFLLDNRHLWLRSQKLTNILKIRHYVSNYIREFFDSKEFYEVVPPTSVKNECEGGSQMFKVD